MAELDQKVRDKAKISEKAAPNLVFAALLSDEEEDKVIDATKTKAVRKSKTRGASHTQDAVIAQPEPSETRTTAQFAGLEEVSSDDGVIYGPRTEKLELEIVPSSAGGDTPNPFDPWADILEEDKDDVEDQRTARNSSPPKVTVFVEEADVTRRPSNKRVSDDMSNSGCKRDMNATKILRKPDSDIGDADKEHQRPSNLLVHRTKPALGGVKILDRRDNRQRSGGTELARNVVCSTEDDASPSGVSKDGTIPSEPLMPQNLSITHLQVTPRPFEVRRGVLRKRSNASTPNSSPAKRVRFEQILGAANASSTAIHQGDAQIMSPDGYIHNDYSGSTTFDRPRFANRYMSQEDGHGSSAYTDAPPASWAYSGRRSEDGAIRSDVEYQGYQDTQQGKTDILYQAQDPASPTFDPQNAAYAQEGTLDDLYNQDRSQSPYYEQNYGYRDTLASYGTEQDRPDEHDIHGERELVSAGQLRAVTLTGQGSGFDADTFQRGETAEITSGITGSDAILTRSRATALYPKGHIVASRFDR